MKFEHKLTGHEKGSSVRRIQVGRLVLELHRSHWWDKCQHDPCWQEGSRKRISFSLMNLGKHLGTHPFFWRLWVYRRNRLAIHFELFLTRPASK
jgi:hypothetical protein